MGFKNGYLTQLEKNGEGKDSYEHIEGCAQIESQIKLFRSKTSVIADVLQNKWLFLEL